MFYFDSNKVETFAGGVENGSRDGTALYSRFYEPYGIAVEFDNVVYVSDVSVGSIKLITPLKRTAEFLSSLYSLAMAFSLHEKQVPYNVLTIDEAIALAEKCVNVVQQNVDWIRNERGGSVKSLNGPEGSVSAVTVDSLHLLLWGLKQLRVNTGKLGYRNINLLSCMTLSLENLHSTVNKKQGTQTLLSYAQSFASSMKESIKKIVEWAAYYFTSKESWYSLPESSIKLEELEFPKRMKSVSKLSSEEKREMREWASSNGAVVRQRSGRQETTMARSGTLPENAYFEELQPFTQNNIQQLDETDMEISSETESLEYESDQTTGNDSDEGSIETPGRIFQTANEATFLIGHASRFGRSVRFNKRYIY